jgi:hypothetical protein
MADLAEVQRRAALARAGEASTATTSGPHPHAALTAGKDEARESATLALASAHGRTPTAVSPSATPPRPMPALAPAPGSAQAPPHPRILSGASPQPRPAAAVARAALPRATGALLQRDAIADDFTDALMLANRSGGALSEAAPGMSSVSFLSRVAEPDAATQAPASPPAGDFTALDDDPEPLDEDALYDRMLRRLRRELLDERERRGRSIGEGRW